MSDPTPLSPGGTCQLLGWQVGFRETQLSALRPGQLLLSELRGQPTPTLLRITRVEPARGLAYALQVDPVDPARPQDPGAGEVGIWDFELAHPDRRYYQARRAYAPDAVAETPPELRAAAADLVLLCKRLRPNAFPEDDRRRALAAMQYVESLVYPPSPVARAAARAHG